MIPELMKCAMVLLFTQVVFMTGTFFISGQLLPSLMLGFYAYSTPLIRTVIAALLIFPVGNFMFAYAYAHFNPAWVTPMSTTAFVLISISFTVLLLGTRLSFWIVPATLMVVAGCTWVSILLEKK